MRQVSPTGHIHWARRRIYLGTRHRGQQIGVIQVEDMVSIYGPDGLAIAQIPWPQPGGNRDVIGASKPPFGLPENPPRPK